MVPPRGRRRRKRPPAWLSPAQPVSGFAPLKALATFTTSRLGVHSVLRLTLILLPLRPSAIDRPDRSLRVGKLVASGASRSCRPQPEHPQLDVHQQCIRGGGVWSRWQRRPGTCLFQPAKELFRLLLHLVQGPPALFDPLQLLRIGRPKHLELSGLEKLDPHAEQPDE